MKINEIEQYINKLAVPSNITEIIQTVSDHIILNHNVKTANDTEKDSIKIAIRDELQSYKFSEEGLTFTEDHIYHKLFQLGALEFFLSHNSGWSRVEFLSEKPIKIWSKNDIMGTELNHPLWKSSHREILTIIEFLANELHERFDERPDNRVMKRSFRNDYVISASLNSDSSSAWLCITKKDEYVGDYLRTILPK